MLLLVQPAIDLHLSDIVDDAHGYKIRRLPKYARAYTELLPEDEATKKDVILWPEQFWKTQGTHPDRIKWNIGENRGGKRMC